jgi:hypothetical protein
MRAALVALGALVLSGSAAAQPAGDFGTTPGTIATPKGGANESLGAGAAAWAKRPNAQGQMREQDYLDELARQYAVAQKLVGAALTEKDRGRIRSAISRDLIAWRTHLTRAVPSIAGCRKSGWWTRARCRPRAGPGSGSSGFAPSRNGFSRGTPDEAWREPFRRLLKSKNAVPNFFRRALSEVR